MDDAELDELAAAWWQSDGTSDAFESVEQMIMRDRASLPAFIRAAVRTVPAGMKISYIGTYILESVHILDDSEGVPDQTLDVLLAADLEPSQMIEILAGVYPHMLKELDLTDRLARILPSDRIAWLLNDAADGRREYL